MLLKDAKYRTKFEGSCVVDFLDRAFDPEGYESQLWAVEAQFMEENGLICDWKRPNHNTITLVAIAAIGLGI